MIIFNVDLDNTLIYSYKQDIGPDKVSVETYEGRQISFVTRETSEKLKQVNQKVLLVPTTTRTAEQYARVDLGIGVPKYALVCNGGVLLANGEEDREWYLQTLGSIAGAKGELAHSLEFLQGDSRRTFELRFIRELFVFTKCREAGAVVKELREYLRPGLAQVFHNGEKVYILPKALEKGQAVRRFREYLGGGEVIAAGDSEFDISMLNASDLAIAPDALRGNRRLSGSTIFMDGHEKFSDELLNYVLKILENKPEI